MIQKNKIITKEIPVTYFIAEDGTEFNDEEQCQKYERSAAGVLLAKLVSCEIIRNYDVEWLDDDDENKYRTILPSNEEDIDILNHLWIMHGGEGKELKFTKEDIGFPILLGWREICGLIDWVWFYKLTDIVKKVTNNTFELKSII